MPRRRHRVWFVLAVAALAAVSFALTATNTVGTGSAGGGSGTIRGYDVTQIRYVPVAADPSRLQRVRFRLTVPGAQLARIRVVPGGAWFTCALAAAGRNANCNLRGTVRVQDASTLDVVAVR